MYPHGEAAAPALPVRLLVSLGAAFLAALAVAALATAASDLIGLARLLPRAPVPVLAVLLGLALALVSLWAAWLAGRSRLSDRALLVIGLAFVALVRGATVLTMDAPLANDGRAYAELANWLANGGCCFAERPTGYPALLAAGYRILGESAWVPEAINVAAAIIGGGLLFGLVRDFFGRRAAALAVAVYAILPTQVLLTPVLLTDVVYSTIVLGLCWAAVRMVGGRIGAAVATGLVLALSQYVRPVAPALLPAMVLVPVLFVRPFRRAAVLAMLLVATFAVAMLPAVVHNLAEHGEASVSTSSYGGWSLLMGTNQESNGRYNDADARLILSLPGETLWDKSEEAERLGFERISSDPIGFAGLVVRKFRIMWGSEEYGVIFGFRPEGRARSAPPLVALDAVAQLSYLAIVAVALAGLVLVLRGNWPASPLVVVVVIGLLLCEAAVHTFLEVKPRYHAHTLPLLLLLAGPVLARWARNGSGEGDAAA